MSNRVVSPNYIWTTVVASSSDSAMEFAWKDLQKKAAAIPSIDVNYSSDRHLRIISRNDMCFLDEGEMNFVVTLTGEVTPVY